MKRLMMLAIALALGWIPSVGMAQTVFKSAPQPGVADVIVTCPDNKNTRPGHGEATAVGESTISLHQAEINGLRVAAELAEAKAKADGLAKCPALPPTTPTPPATTPYQPAAVPSPAGEFSCPLRGPFAYQLSGFEGTTLAGAWAALRSYMQSGRLWFLPDWLVKVEVDSDPPPKTAPATGKYSLDGACEYGTLEFGGTVYTLTVINGGKGLHINVKNSSLHGLGHAELVK